MKTDREFLNGVYEKAEIIKRENKKSLLNRNTYLRIATSLALILLILPVSISITKPEMNVPAKYAKQLSSALKANEYFSLDEIFTSSDLIVTAKVKNISKAQLDKDKNVVTDVVVNVHDVYKGKNFVKNRNYISSINVKVDGGYDKKSDTFLNYEAVFNRGEEVLLFLSYVNDEYILSSGRQSKYTLDSSSKEKNSYISEDGKVIYLDELKSLFEEN